MRSINAHWRSSALATYGRRSRPGGLKRTRPLGMEFLLLFQFARPLVGLRLGLIAPDAVAFLDFTYQLIFLSGHDRPVIFRQFSPLLSGMAGELLPVAFDSVPVHNKFPPVRR